MTGKTFVYFFAKTVVFAPMRIVRSICEMQTCAAQLRTQRKAVAFVPTMGCLHEGHLRLVDMAREQARAVVVSIFVNPVQFGPGEDFEKYPRTEVADIAACESRGVDVVFLPHAKEMFPPDFSTFVEETLCSTGLCGTFRHGHFRGVATVVLMLLNIVRPDVAIFGQKDAQQIAVLRKMVADLFLPVEIVTGPTVREMDGLALSSRNRYLSTEERAVAPELSAALEAGRRTALPGVDATIVKEAVAAHLARFPLFRVQYIAFVDAVSMRPIDTVPSEREAALLAVAAHLGATRLIDNILIQPSRQ